ncbi:MAG: hypothetical protein NTZ44_00330 [Candidatus Nomurabacteria bacterium]|nr:hypothetical protein [Candidatus Nomurabacteria bacterium]MCX6788850.1 hypothetical protein [Candidatus Jorgensenbacteria bacterium]
MNEMPNEVPLVGPSVDEREVGELSPTEVRLADGGPLYLLLLDNPEAPYASAEDTFEAKNKLAELIAVNKDAVLSCEGKSREEAMAILDAVEPASLEEVA